MYVLVMMYYNTVCITWSPDGREDAGIVLHCHNGDILTLIFLNLHRCVVVLISFFFFFFFL